MRSGRTNLGLITLLVMLIAVLFTAACGSSSKSSTPTPGTTKAPATTATKAPASATGTPAATAATPSGTAQANSVTIADFAFTPPSITVKVGDTVTWTNNGPSTHTATADDGSFDSGNLAQGKTFSHTFQTAGTFSYHCTIHPFMKAEVVVQAGSSASNLPGY